PRRVLQRAELRELLPAGSHGRLHQRRRHHAGPPRTEHPTRTEIPFLILKHIRLLALLLLLSAGAAPAERHTWNVIPCLNDAGGIPTTLNAANLCGHPAPQLCEALRSKASGLHEPERSISALICRQVRFRSRPILKHCDALC